jgi:beta-galactosidase
MYDYNTFHNTNEPGMVWHGICDLFRIPKYTYWWHMSELTSKPMAHLIRIDDQEVEVFSNCEKVRLLEDDGGGYREFAVHNPETNFTSAAGRQIQFVLHHPPFRFKVSKNALGLEAEGLINDTIVATSEVRRPRSPMSLKIEADRPTIIADGADITRIIVTAVDENGTPIDTCDKLVKFNIEGAGQLLGDNPVHLRAGQIIILAQSGFIPGDLEIEATADGLPSDKIKVKMERASSDEDIPKNLRMSEPTERITPGNDPFSRTN